MSSWVVDSSDKFVIGIFLGSAAVGCYSPGYALGSILLMFLTPFAVLLPAVLPEYFEKGDMDKVNTFLTYSMKYYLLLTIPAAVGMSLLSKRLLFIFTTDIIKVIVNAKPIIPISAFIFFSLSLFIVSPIKL